MLGRGFRISRGVIVSLRRDGYGEHRRRSAKQPRRRLVSGPDSARVISNVGYTALGRENIVIGSQVWERRDSGWSASTTNVDCYNALVRINAILAYGGNHDDSVDGVDGPTMGREPTRLYKGTYEDAGRLLISEAERSLGDSPQTQEALAHTREVFRDLTATTVLIVGKNTGRVYSLVYASNGPKMTRKDEIVVDQFDQPVDIQPPPDVAAPTGDQNASRCPEPAGDFPWIPAAIAAVLGPLLFLGASAFLWPRHL